MGLTSRCRKRAFGQDTVPSQDQPLESGSADSPLLARDDNVDVQDLMNELIQDANDDTNDDSNDDDIIPTQAVPSSQSRTAAQHPIPLALLFSFADPSSATSLGFYWKGGLKNMERETAAYDMMHDEGNSELPTTITPSAGPTRLECSRF